MICMIRGVDINCCITPDVTLPEIAKLIKVKRKIRRMLKEDPIPGLKPLYNKLNKLVREKINQ